MTDYTQMDHEELAAAADPLNRIVNRDEPILGNVPTDEQVDEAKLELEALNAAAITLQLTHPHHVGAVGPEMNLLPEDEIKMLVEHRLAKRREAEA